MAYKLQNEQEGNCLQCGTLFTGRKDKHFCSLSCKNAFHNAIQQEKRHRRSEIIAALSGNYEILEALLREKRTSAPLADLANLGFDPAYVTGHRKGRFGHDDYACFDIWYYQTDTRVFNVRRKASGER